MAKLSRKLSTKRSKRPRRSKSSSRKTMKRTKRQSSRKHTSRKPKKVKRKSVRKRKRTINDIKKGGVETIKSIAIMLENNSIDLGDFSLITPIHLIKLNNYCNDNSNEEVVPLRGKYFLYSISNYDELLEKKCIPEIPDSIPIHADTNLYGLFYIKPDNKDPATFFENKVICISIKKKDIKLISPGAPGAPDAHVVKDLNTQNLNFLEIVEESKLIKDGTTEIRELQRLMGVYQSDIIPGPDAHPIDAFL